jgi:hypothetical protein
MAAGVMESSFRVTSTVFDAEAPLDVPEFGGPSAVEPINVLTATSTTRNVAKMANESNRFSDT